MGGLLVIAGVLVVIFMVLFGSKKLDQEQAKKSLPPQIKSWLPEISQAASKTGVPENIITAVLWVESNGNEQAVGSAGEKGLMQLKEIAVQDVRENMNVDIQSWDVIPWNNIMAGAYFLALQYQRTGTWEKALKAYNQGQRGAQLYPERAEKYYQKVKSKLDSLGGI